MPTCGSTAPPPHKSDGSKMSSKSSSGTKRRGITPPSLADVYGARFPTTATAGLGACSTDEFRDVAGKLDKKGTKTMLDARKKQRTDLEIEEWTQAKHCDKPRLLDEPLPIGKIARVHVDSMSKEEFEAEFERKCRPCVIEGVVEKWAASSDWTPTKLYSKYKNVPFKCGEDDDGFPIKVKLKHFFRYIGAQEDDSPLYVFDSGFDSKRRAGSMLDDYRPPEYFADDLFRFAGYDRRPPYRWVLFGPRRSGSCVHLDPLGTSAWNAAIRGRKLWVLMPPILPKEVVKSRRFQDKDGSQDDEAIDYFTSILPRACAAVAVTCDRMEAAGIDPRTGKPKAKDKSKGGISPGKSKRPAPGASSSSSSSSSPSSASASASASSAAASAEAAAPASGSGAGAGASPAAGTTTDQDIPRTSEGLAELAVRGAKQLGVVLYVQRPGETMYVPSGWWHAVLNLDDTIAVTQNFCTPALFPRVWVRTRTDRRAMSRRWLAALRAKRPAIAAVADEINRRDGWSMVATEKEREKLRRKVRRRARKRAKELEEHAKKVEAARAKGEEIPSEPEESSTDSSVTSISSSDSKSSSSSSGSSSSDPSDSEGGGDPGMATGGAGDAGR